MLGYFSTNRVHLATGIYLIVAHLLAFLLTNPPNPTLLTGVFFGVVFLISFSNWKSQYRWSQWMILFLYISLLIGLFGPCQWAFFQKSWAVFSILILSYMAVLGNILLQSIDLRNQMQLKKPKTGDEEE